MSMNKELKTQTSPAQTSIGESIAYTVIFDNIDGKLISTPTIKKKPKSERKPKVELGVLNDDDEKLMADILEEVESKERREKLEEKLMIAEIMRDAHNKVKMEKARKSRIRLMTETADQDSVAQSSNEGSGSN